MDNSDFNTLLDAFRRGLQDCQQLYRASGRVCVHEHPHLIAKSAGEFVQWMDDLHKAFLIKIYVTICEADRRWSVNEQRLGSELFQHAWGRRLDGDELRAAVRQVSAQAASLKWYSVIRPFDQIAPLRGRIGELETIAMRLANIVAKADGVLPPVAAAHLRHLQSELRCHLQPIPVDEPGQHEEAARLGAEAIRTLRTEADHYRRQCERAAPRPATAAAPAESLAEMLAELDRLIGLAGVKREVHTLVNFLHVQDARRRAGLPTTRLSLHMVFYGNPGTGKTTVARIIGKIYGALGLLARGHLVETDRSGLVAEYAGQTAVKTNKKVDEALDGVLFVDEAYSLIAEGGDDPYGHEAVQTLLKRMEDDRQRLVVILAGYPEPMGRLLSSNPGLSSRFSRQLVFDDYSPCELGQIFHRMCEASQYTVPPLARAKLLLGLQWLYEHRDERFGNGRTVRNFFELAIRRLANRIANVARLTRAHLTVIQPEDIELVGVPPELLADLAARARKFHVQCPGCRETCPMPQEYLGRKVKCNRCGHEFVAEWGDPLPAC